MGGLEPRGLGQVREVRDHELDRLRKRVEQVALEDVHPVLEPVTRDVQARERDGLWARVGGEDLDIGRREPERHCNGAGARADVGDPFRARLDPLERGVDEPLGRRPRREHAPGRDDDRDAVEEHLHRHAGCHTRGVRTAVG